MVFKITSRDQGWSTYASQKGTYAGAYSWLEVELWRKPESTDFSSSTEAASTEPVKIDTCLLQRNLHAISQWTDHEIVWDWKEDELPDDNLEKWEEGHTDSWHRGGKMKNGKFVRELRGGDEIRVVMRAMYAGWRCMVKKGEVECFWAV